MPRAIFILLVFLNTNVFSAIEQELIVRCENAVSKYKQSSAANLEYAELEFSHIATLPSLNIWNGNIPMVVHQNSVLALFGPLENKRISFIDKKNDLLQSISITELYSRVILKDGIYSALEGMTLWEAILESLEISDKDINCNSLKENGYNEKNIKQYTRNLILLSLKQMFAPYNSTGLIKTKNQNSIIITHESGFEFFQSFKNYTLQVLVIGTTQQDLINFTKSLENLDNQTFYSESINELVSTWEINNIEAWEKTRGKFESNNASEEILDSIDQQIEYLQRNQKLD